MITLLRKHSTLSLLSSHANLADYKRRSWWVYGGGHATLIYSCNVWYRVGIALLTTPRLRPLLPLAAYLLEVKKGGEVAQPLFTRLFLNCILLLEMCWRAWIGESFERLRGGKWDIVGNRWCWAIILWKCYWSVFVDAVPWNVVVAGFGLFWIVRDSIVILRNIWLHLAYFRIHFSQLLAKINKKKQFFSVYIIYFIVNKLILIIIVQILKYLYEQIFFRKIPNKR